MGVNIRNKNHASFIDRTGEKHLTNQGYNIEIVECYGVENMSIKFESGFILNNVNYLSIKKRNIRYPFHPTSYGVGYLGIGKHETKVNGKETLAYKKWNGMLERCYSKSNNNRLKNYSDCYVDKKWHNFQNFAEWFQENYNPELMKSWHLDKDLLSNGNKCYSEKTCCFLPLQINVIFKKNKEKGSHGVWFGKRDKKWLAIYSNIYLGSFNTEQEAIICYNKGKIKYIKIVAENWKNKISESVYQALINYKS